MGSFATSLHVKSTDPDRVASSLTEILTGSGWRPTPKTFAREDSWGEPSNWRALQVSAARDGWVSILDRDLGGSHALTATLAAQLATHAILFFVNDSDSWSYLLADAKGATSEFDSEEGADDDDDGGDLVDAASAFAQVNALMRDGSILQKMQEMQARMSEGAPPDIRAAEERIKSGRGIPADMQQYQAWAMQEMPKYMAEMRSLLGPALPTSRAQQSTASKKPRQRSKSEQAAWKKRLSALRPLLAPGVTDDQVQAVLDKRAIFAEEILAEFLPLLGLSDYYANLSYRYLNESSSHELSSHDIRFLHHLRFESSSPRLFTPA